MVIFGKFVTVVTFGTPMQLHFCPLGIRSVLSIIPSEFWYIWFTLAHVMFGTPDTGWYTVLYQLYFGTLRIGSLFSTLGIIPSELC